MALPRKGLRGEPVRRLQSKLGVGADGIFGDATDKALRAYQEKAGLAVDDIAGPATLAKMDLFTDVTAKTVELAKVPSNYIEPKPPPSLKLDDAAIAASKKAAATAQEASQSKGIWGTVKGWFS